ncbi:hypothetical protein BMF94_3691 [Rhodotorula taiwanensis]|uniref:NADP-dependent oxidoreductase domain-containing protein n=1 Tax=Rhodotorula taiwanensis TaxID=741276 RepID=A0A2S5B9A2_9BASI|nr:hypothetical protein BMF94_3691 [Rhodotorula taiwanensis]
MAALKTTPPRLIRLASDLEIPQLGYGAMGLSQSYGVAKDPESKETLRHAIEIGCQLWNTATIYGQDQHNEKLIGEILRESDNRDKVTLVTKWGLKLNDGKLQPDGSAAFARHCIDQSIWNLGSPPDIWLLHRIDQTVAIEESVQAMEDARRAGKCRFIGLSAMSASTLRRAAKAGKIDFVEMEFSPFETAIEDNGVLDACKELGVKILAYSPLGKGALTGKFKSFEDFEKEGDMRSTGLFPRFNRDAWEHNVKLVNALEELAKEKQCSPGQLALAWDMQVHGDLIIPIPGTKSIKYLDENWASQNVQLNAEALAKIRSILRENPVHGEQYSEAMNHLLDHE